MAGVILAMMLMLAVVEVRGLNSIRDSLNEIVGIHYQRQRQAQEMRFAARHCGVLVRNFLLVADQTGRQRERQRFDEGAGRYAKLLRQMTAQNLSAKERSILSEVIRDGSATFRLWQQVLTTGASGDLSQAMALLAGSVRNQQWGWLDSLGALVQLESSLAEDSMAKALRDYHRTRIVMAMVNVLAIGAALFLVAAISAGIVGPLHEIIGKVDRIARGDLSTRIEMHQEDEIGLLITHINQMVEKLQASEEELEKYRYHLEELIEWRTGEINDQRERFISVLIHDLKGPLVPIIGFSRLLMNKKRLTEERIHEYARAIHESTMKLSFAIEETSQNLRAKQLSYSFDREPFDIEELLSSVSKSCQPGLGDHHISLRVNNQQAEEFKSSGQLLYAGDIGKVRSLFENLIGNACKYAESTIDIRITGSDEQVELIVDDDGRGVAEPYRTKIFEEYYQAPGSKNGTGVGLYSVKRIVEHYQGEITVTSSPAGGARFVVVLPKSEQ